MSRRRVVEGRPRRAFAFGLALASWACAGSGDVAELASPIPGRLPPGVAAGVELDIERSVPEVSYERPSDAERSTSGAAALDPSGTLTPAEVRQLIRSLESLDGERQIVCAPSGRRAFGDCVFPLAPEPRRAP